MSEIVNFCVCTACSLVFLPAPFRNGLGWGWQSRLDKPTQLVSSDRAERSVSFLLYIPSSIFWQRQPCVMRWCVTAAIHISPALPHLVSFTHFLTHSFSLISLVTCLFIFFKFIFLCGYISFTIDALFFLL